MKRSDVIAVGYLVLYAAIVFFFPFNYGVRVGISPEGLQAGKEFYWTGFNFCSSFTDLTGLKQFGAVVAGFPYLSGFLKVALLATFGEMVKTRGKTGSWTTPNLFPKFIVWGLYGMLFSLVFALFAMGVERAGSTNLWFGYAGYSYATASWGWRFVMGFSTSLWCNLIFCYPMMLSHEWFNQIITKKRFIGGAEFMASLDPKVWGSFMLKTIVVFWIPAHTVTFCLPPDYRVLMSAVLSLALGFILTVKPHK